MSMDETNEELKKRFFSLSDDEKEKFLRSINNGPETNTSNILIRKLYAAIESGETKTVEFKSSLSLDINKGTKEKYIELAAVKTVCGFLNSIGGLLILGLNDFGEIIGIDSEIEKFHKSNDKFLLHLKSVLKTRLGEKYFELIDQHLIMVSGKQLLLVDCKQSKIPVYVDDCVCCCGVDL